MDEDFSFELQQTQYVLLIEVTNRGDSVTIEKEVAMLKEFYKRLEQQFPGQQVPQADLIS